MRTAKTLIRLSGWRTCHFVGFVMRLLICWATPFQNGPRQANLVLMRAPKVQASLRIRAVSPEPPLLAHTSNESRGIFRQKPISLAPLNVWACAVKICHDGMLEDTNSLDGAQMCQMWLLHNQMASPWVDSLQSRPQK